MRCGRCARQEQLKDVWKSVERGQTWEELALPLAYNEDTCRCRTPLHTLQPDCDSHVAARWRIRARWLLFRAEPVLAGWRVVTSITIGNDVRRGRVRSRRRAWPIA